MDGCTLASQRLSILDLSPHGHMPMASEDGRLLLVYNGEVYNYVEIRAELAARGHRFRSTGDTEVVLRAYQEWGANCVERFVGMWALALYDRAERSLLLCRDRFGIKPLYLQLTPERVVFASEIKALVAYLRAYGEPVRVHTPAVATYLATGQVDGWEETFFAGVKRLEPGTWLRITPSGEEKRRYWSLPDRAKDLSGTLRQTDVVGQIRAGLEESVRVHLRSDVPLGVCLSGGLDSSGVVALASARVQPVETYTIWFGDGPEYDERAHERAVVAATGASPHEQEATSADFLDTVRRIIWHLDEPSLATGVYPQWKVMELARSGVKVVLDGQGGDEVFGGYTNYLPQYLYGLARGWSPRLVPELVGVGRVHGWGKARAVGRSAVAMAARPAQPATAETLGDASLLTPEARVQADTRFEEWRLWPRVFDDWLNNVLYWELTKTRLPALLRYEDRLSMAFSLESRVPFLDHRLVEMSFALPGAWKVRGGWSKYVLRRALDDALPREVVWRRDKKGFPTPVGHWLSDQRGAEARAVLRDPSRKTREWVSESGLEADLRAQETGQDRSWRLWRALSLELWLDVFGL